MTSTPHAFDGLPHGLTEADLLAWIEADARTRAAAPEGSALRLVDQAAASDPRLGAMLEAMRVDRAALGSLETPAPPQWLAQAVLEEHERQALMALSDMAAMGPRAADRDADDGFSFSAMPRWFKPAMAVAALLALAFGAWQLAPFLLRGAAPPPGPQIAANDATTDPATNPATDQPIAAAPGPTTQPTPVVATAPLPPAIEPVRVPEPTAREVLAARLDMPVDDALELALAGRLMVVVSVDAPLAARESIESVAAQPIDATWRLTDAHGELVAAMATPDHARLIGLEGFGEGPLTANGRGPLGRLEVVMAAAPTVVVAEASASPEALLDLLDGLALLGRDVRLVGLEEALPGSGPVPAPAIESSLLWWQGDPAAWQPWAAIPVRFIEAR